MPDSKTVCGLPVELSVKLSVPVTALSVVGVKVTFTVHFLPASSVAPHVLMEIVKGPALWVMETLVMPSVAVPVFVSVTVLAVLVVLMG